VTLVPRFLAEVSFHFESETQMTVGADLRRLSQAAQEVGFQLKRSKVTEAPPDEEDESGWTGYGPLIDPDDTPQT
jgi:hypothetical protein